MKVDSWVEARAQRVFLAICPQLVDSQSVTESRLLEEESTLDYFKLKFCSKFPLPDCKNS